VEQAADPQQLLKIKLAPDMLDTGLNLAIATGFAARALCLPAQVKIPDIPETITCAALQTHHQVITDLIAPLSTDMLHTPIQHQAGEAQLTQEVSDYILRYALPNMIFHLSVAYAGLRHGGLQIGKADFDGLHVYTSRLD